jgi:hypothetical protein
MSEIFLAVTIDCECDKGARWRAQSPLAFEGVREGVGRRLAPLFRAYRAKPTYLLSPEVLRDPESVEVFRAEEPFAELGTHLHGEYAEPGSFEPDVTSAFQRDYPPEVERQKLAHLTASFQSAFGRSPRSFRAGRFGVGPHSMGLLESLGYVADTSVTPFVSWEDEGARGLSFIGAPTQPYRPARLSPGQRARAGESRILEVPVTIRPHPLARLPWLGRRAPARWLRPSRMSGAALTKVAGEEIQRARRDAPGLPVVLNAMFHNVEVIAGASPYAATEREARTILERLAQLLAFAARESIRVVGLCDVAEIFA